MLSRVAEAIYWMSRYIERAENVARFVDVNAHLSLDVPSGGEQWAPLVATTGDEAYFKEHYGQPTRDRVLNFLTFDRNYSSSIVSCLRIARDNARSVREIISSEMWEQVNKAYLMVKDGSLEAALDAPHAFYSEIKQASHLFVGITYLTMTHNEAWHFSRLGRLIERADKTSRIVDVKYFILLPDVGYVGMTFDEIQWGALLKSASAFEMYRKRHGRIVPANVVDFLLFERQFPRSLRYCLRKAERSLHAITGAPLGEAETAAEREIGRLHAQLEYAESREIMKRGLHEYLDDFQLKLNHVGDTIFETFFALAPEEAAMSQRWSLERAHNPPTEAQLEAARAERDALFEALRAAWKRGDADSAAYERARRDADALADRLRREAERVARAASLHAEKRSLAEGRARVQDARDLLARRKEETLAQWRATWASASLDPLSPAEMRAWLARHAQLVTLVEQLDAARAEESRRAALRHTQRRRLAEAMGAPLGEEPLAVLRDRGAALLASREESARERREVTRQIAEVSEEVERLQAELASHEATLEAWRARWRGALEPLGLSPELEPEAALAVLEAWGALSQKREESARARRRLQAIAEEDARFAREVARLLATHAPDLDLPAGAAAAQLLKRHHQAARDAATGREIDQQLARLAEEERAETERLARARADLARLMSAAGATDLEALRAAEERSAEARETERVLAELEEQLLHAGQGLGIEALLAEANAVDPAALEAELEAADARVHDLEGQRARVERRIGGIEQAMNDDLKRETEAPAAAAEAQEHLAQARAHAERFVRLKLASAILARAVETWREKNQGPIVQRASALFKELTLGSFGALDVGFGDSDEPALRGLRPDGKPVDVSGMSDGTRDQLFLALRLASLERYLESAPPLPLVVDDILIHFDDDRARAALRLLGALSAKTQVLFFTHHARLVELARGLHSSGRNMCEIHTLSAGAPQQAMTVS